MRRAKTGGASRLRDAPRAARYAGAPIAPVISNAARKAPVRLCDIPNLFSCRYVRSFSCRSVSWLSLAAFSLPPPRGLRDRISAILTRYPRGVANK